MSKSKTNQKPALPIRKYDYFKIAICAAVACAVMLIMYALNNSVIYDGLVKLEESKESPNLLWLAKHLAAAAPTLAAVLAMCVVYSNKEKYVPIYTQKEKLFVSLILAAMTVMMLIFVIITDGKVDSKDGVLTLFEKTYTWFAAQIIPLSVLIAYHSIRSGTERRELEESGAKK